MRVCLLGTKQHAAAVGRTGALAVAHWHRDTTQCAVLEHQKYALKVRTRMLHRLFCMLSAFSFTK